MPYNFHAIDIAKTGHYLPNDPTNKRNLSFFIKLLNETKADGVQLVLLETPEYFATQQSYQSQEEFFSAIKGYIKPMDHVSIIRQSSFNTINPRDETLFFDGGYGNEHSHLSFDGSQIFTRELLGKLGH
jgi:hypothetical protein